MSGKQAKVPKSSAPKGSTGPGAKAEKKVKRSKSESGSGKGKSAGGEAVAERRGYDDLYQWVTNGKEDMWESEQIMFKRK